MSAPCAGDPPAPEEPSERHQADGHHPPVDYDVRYKGGWAYGKAPDPFLARAAAEFLPPGAAVVSLGEGQGRHAVHLAERGHPCLAVDLSPVGLRKSALLAEQRGVAHRVTTLVADLATFDPPPCPWGDDTNNRWGAIISVFCALPPATRRALHRRCLARLAPGGVVILVCFAPGHAAVRGAATSMAARCGPVDPAFLASARDVVRDFTGTSGTVPGGGAGALGGGTKEDSGSGADGTPAAGAFVAGDLSTGAVEVLHCEEERRFLRAGKFVRGDGLVTQVVIRKR